MTGMMEDNQTLSATVRQEVEDITDIAHGANMSLESLMGCVVNVRRDAHQVTADDGSNDDGSRAYA